MTIAILIAEGIGGRMKDMKKMRKEALSWELEDQLKDLKEQLDRGVITQEKYKQKKEEVD